MNLVTYTVGDGIGHIRLNRPEKYNAFIREMALAMQEFLTLAAQDDSVRAILLTSEGKAFCAGQDLKEFTEDNGIDVSRIVDEHYNPIVKKMAELDIPIVCAVNGVAAGAGANLALACDIVIAAKSATFIQAFSKIGLIPDTGGTFYLPRLIGMQKAKALMMLADSVSAEEAERIGMIYRAVEDDELFSEAMKLSKRLASMPTIALGLTKRALSRSLTNDLDKQLGIESQLQSTATQTSDFTEGVAAFLEKRKPNFTGR
jgi:2-(1,2-epoxy-1,2-dihydrophenyl)acetyl-CoA isomerase